MKIKKTMCNKVSELRMIPLAVNTQLIKSFYSVYFDPRNILHNKNLSAMELVNKLHKISKT